MDLELAADGQYLFSASWNVLGLYKINDDFSRFKQVNYLQWLGQTELKGLWNIKTIKADSKGNVIVGSFGANSITKYTINKITDKLEKEFFFEVGLPGVVNEQGLESFAIDNKDNTYYVIDPYNKSLKSFKYSNANLELITEIYEGNGGLQGIDEISSLSISTDNTILLLASESNNSLTLIEEVYIK